MKYTPRIGGGGDAGGSRPARALWIEMDIIGGTIDIGNVEAREGLVD